MPPFNEGPGDQPPSNVYEIKPSVSKQESGSFQDDQEGDFFKKSPDQIPLRLAQELDLHVNSAATIAVLIDHVRKNHDGYYHEGDVNEMLINLGFLGGKHSKALQDLKEDLMSLEDYLRKIVGSKTYFEEILPKRKKLEQEIKEHSEFVLTAGGEE
jgi:hypothetical protein